MCLASGLHSSKRVFHRSLCLPLILIESTAFTTTMIFVKLQKAKHNTKKPSLFVLCPWKFPLKKECSFDLVKDFSCKLWFQVVKWSLKKVFSEKYFHYHNSESDKSLNPVSVKSGKLKLLSNLTFPICSWKCHPDPMIKETQRRTANLLLFFPLVHFKNTIFIQESLSQNKSLALRPVCVSSTSHSPCQLCLRTAVMYLTEK